MNEEIQMALESAREQMDKAIKHLEAEFGIRVDYYGSLVPLGQVSNVNSTDARTLVIQPWERSMLDPISTAIINANLGLNPMNNGEVIMLNVPPLTEERRRDLTKRAKAEGEHAKVGVRNARKDANDYLKSAKSEGLSEDLVKVGETKVQELTDAFIKKVDDLVASKEADIMTV
ncbi:MAG: Ribosome recycling factor [Bacteroidota bacterium]